MTNTLMCSNFPGAYPALSGSMPITATHRDITRSMLTVGYPSYKNTVRNVGPWRARLLQSMMKGYLDHSLRTTRYFRNLEPSEKTAMTFLLAQALTHWFAQEHMDMFHLVHLKGPWAAYTPQQAPVPLKSGASQPGIYSRPDFIGRSSTGFHVFEAKGRSSPMGKDVMPKALGQVSMLANVNSQPPMTRVAACFEFLSTGVTGYIQDPPKTSNAKNLDFEERHIVDRAYAFFLDKKVRSSLSEEVTGFQCLRIDGGLIFGVDKKVLSKLDAVSSSANTEKGMKPLLNLLEERQKFYDERRDDNISIGRDGIILKGATCQPKRHRRISKNYE